MSSALRAYVGVFLLACAALVCGQTALALGKEVRTHEVPQDDVPDEYLDKE